jgi:hypothetical protein
MGMGMSGGYQQPNNSYQQQNNLYQQQSFQQQIPSYQPMQFSPPQNAFPFNAAFGMNTNTSTNMNINVNSSNNNSNISSMNNAGHSNAKDDDPFGFLQ